jgi:putative ABC transport system permease protein
VSTALRFALRGLRRDWRAGELRVLLLALVVSVAAVTAVAFFTDRVYRGMTDQAGELLAADLVVVSPGPIPDDWLREARHRALGVALTLEFPSVVVAGERLQLAEVKAVGTGYPLRGALRTSQDPFAPDRPAAPPPPPGQAWAEPRLLAALGTQIGGRISAGRLELQVVQVLRFEPDRGGDLFSLGPRLLMNLDDIPATALVQAGSRVRHRLLLAGPADSLAAYRAWITPRLGASQQVQDVRDSRPELRTALERAQRFLGLAAMVSVLLAGAAVAVAARRYALRHLDSAALMRCLGADQGFVGRVYLVQVFALALAAGALGSALGHVAQAGLAGLLSGLLGGTLPPPSLAPWATGMAVSLVTLVGFGLPPLMRLREVPPARVLRRELAPLPARARMVYGSALAALAGLVAWQAQDLRLAGYVVAGALAGTAVLVGGGLLLVRALGPMRRRSGAGWRLGMAGLARRSGSSTLQVAAFGTGITVLLLLGLVRADLLESWQRSLPADSPNYFLINIQPDEVPALRAFLAEQGLGDGDPYPMVRGRLSAIGGRPVAAGDYEDPRAQRLVEREFNLSWATRPQADNRIVAGRWWQAGARQELSVEQGLAETLGIRLGDELQFLVAGQAVQARVTSLRSVEWDSFRPNFFVLGPPDLLQGFPATYITSLFLAPGHEARLAELIHRHPSVTVLDVSALLGKVRALMDQAALAVQYVFLFTLLAGVTVLLAAVQSTLDERRFEAAVARTLGARRSQLLGALVAEFAALGALAGLLASGISSVVGLVLAQQVFQMDYHPSVWTAVVGIVGGALGVGAAGLLGTRRVLADPPLQTLRAGG